MKNFKMQKIIGISLFFLFFATNIKAMTPESLSKNPFKDNLITFFHTKPNFKVILLRYPEQCLNIVQLWFLLDNDSKGEELKDIKNSNISLYFNDENNNAILNDEEKFAPSFRQKIIKMAEKREISTPILVKFESYFYSPFLVLNYFVPEKNSSMLLEILIANLREKIFLSPYLNVLIDKEKLKTVINSLERMKFLGFALSGNFQTSTLLNFFKEAQHQPYVPDTIYPDNEFKWVLKKEESSYLKVLNFIVSPANKLLFIFYSLLNPEQQLNILTLFGNAE